MRLSSAALVLLLILGLANARLTEKQKLEVLRYHNDLRNKVSPKASNMAKLVRICFYLSYYEYPLEEV